VGARPVHLYSVNQTSSAWSHSDAEGAFYVIPLDNPQNITAATIVPVSIHPLPLSLRRPFILVGHIRDTAQRLLTIVISTLPRKGKTSLPALETSRVGWVLRPHPPCVFSRARSAVSVTPRALRERVSTAQVLTVHRSATIG
jgi:hypothetical protein